MLQRCTRALYRGAGESVLYAPVQGAPRAIDVIITRDSQLFGRAVEADYADTAITARIQKADFAEPRRGDVLTDANQGQYRVENVNTNFNDSESEVELKALD